MKNLNNRLRTIIAAVMMLLATLPSLAHDFEVDGIYYNYLDKSAKTVAVTYKGSDYDSYSNEYTGSITIPSSVTYSGITYSVAEIDFGAFADCTGLTSITIPNSVTKIGGAAFGGCTGITEVTIPNSVTEIGWRAFDSCTGLTEVTIPNSVTEIGYCAFNNTGWYNNQADGVVYINNVLYRYEGTMPEGTSILIKNGTVSISPGAFADCTGLTEVTIPNSVTVIGMGAFKGCTRLKSIIIQNPDVVIGEDAIPEGVEVIIEK